MQEKIWLKSYSSGVPAEADWCAYPSVRHMYQAAVHRYRIRPAFTNMGTALTYAEVDRLSRDFAGYLQKELGLAKGDRLAIMLPNVLQYPVVLFGAFLAGLTVVNVNPLYTPRELQYQLLDSGTHAIVVLENFAHTVEEVLDECALRAVITTRLGDLLSPPMSYVTNFVVKYIKRMVPQWTIPRATALGDVLGMGRSNDLQEVDLGPDDIAFLQYTSGTTGAPKGAVLTHRKVIANVRQNNVWCGSVVKAGVTAGTRRCAMGMDDRSRILRRAQAIYVIIGTLRLLCDVPTLDRDADRFEKESYCERNRADPNRRRKQHQ